MKIYLKNKDRNNIVQLREYVIDNMIKYKNKEINNINIKLDNSSVILFSIALIIGIAMAITVLVSGLVITEKIASIAGLSIISFEVLSKIISYLTSIPSVISLLIIPLVFFYLKAKKEKIKLEKMKREDSYNFIRVVFRDRRYTNSLINIERLVNELSNIDADHETISEIISSLSNIADHKEVISEFSGDFNKKITYFCIWNFLDIICRRSEETCQLQDNTHNNTGEEK